MNYCLIDFPILAKGKVASLTGKQSICQKFYEMGIRKGAQIQNLGRLPFSQNVHIIVGNESMVLREEEARLLEVCSS